MKRKITAVLLTVLSLMVIPTPLRVHADVAPPQQPPGSALDPGAETQVRMMSEVVRINIERSASPDVQPRAAVKASFVMRNLGDQTEYLNVRFPLADVSGYGDGFGGNPEIDDLRVKVNGESVLTTRITTPNESGFSDASIPWSSFLVAFPPNEDVNILVDYTLEGTSRESDPLVNFSYILETGAGWRDTIGSAEIVVHLPYEASFENIGRFSGFSIPEVSINPEFSGQEVRWLLEDFEPDASYNLKLSVLKPHIWLRVINETENVTNNPNDGEAWGRLGKAYKEAITDPKGYVWEDLNYEDIYKKAEQAYEKAVSLKPNDALWHYGFADLLWMYYLSFNYKGDYTDTLVRALEELNTSLILDSDNERALELAGAINSWMPEFVQFDGADYIFTALTQTPVYVSPTPWETPTYETLLATPVPGATKPAALLASPTIARSSIPESTPVPTAIPSGTPICGGAAMIIPIAAGIYWLTRRRLAY